MKEKLVRLVLVTVPLPKFQKRLVMVPLEVSVKKTERGAIPLVGAAEKRATGAAIWPQQVRTRTETVSTNQPVLVTLLSVPQRQRSWTGWPAAAAGRLTMVVMKPPELPLQPWRPPSGLLKP